MYLNPRTEKSYIADFLYLHAVAAFVFLIFPVIFTWRSCHKHFNLSLGDNSYFTYLWRSSVVNLGQEVCYGKERCSVVLSPKQRDMFRSSQGENDFTLMSLNVRERKDSLFEKGLCVDPGL